MGIEYDPKTGSMTGTLFGDQTNDALTEMMRNGSQAIYANEQASRPAYEGHGDMPAGQNYVPGYDNRRWDNVNKASAYEYGGHTGGAAEEQARYAGLASAADMRAAPTMDLSGYNAARYNDLKHGIDQVQGLDRFKTVINGTGPSVAALQQQQGLAAANAQGAQLAGGARGGGAGLIAAQNAGIGMSGAASSNAVMQGGMGRLGEQSGALAGYSGLANTARSGNLARAQQSSDMAHTQGQLQAQQNSLNDQRNLDYERMRQGVSQAQLHAQMAGEEANQGVYASNEQMAANQADRDAARRNALIAATASAAGSGLAAASKKKKSEDGS